MAKVDCLDGVLETLGDPAVELTIGRSCADVSKVGHLLRTFGDVLAGAPTAGLDGLQQSVVKFACE